MSLAREPGRSGVSHAAARVRWAIGAPALALVALATLGTTLWLATRRLASVAEGTRPARSVGLHPVRKRALSVRPAAQVQIVERPRPRRVVKPKPALEPVEANEETNDPVPSQPPAIAPRSPKLSANAQRPRKPLREAVALPPAAVTPPAPAAPRGNAEEKVITPPEPEDRPEARYPEDAAAEGVTGSVRLKVVVGRRGQVEDALVVRTSGDDRLDRAAASAVRRWRYRPAQQEGRSIAAVDYVEVEFYREDEEKTDKR